MFAKFLGLFALTLLAGSLTSLPDAAAQVQVTVAVPVPTFEFEIGAPLVYAAPGVYVLPQSDEEVFYTGGWYWAHHGDRWYRSHGRHRGWVVMDNGYVPMPLMRMERGHYRRWQAPPQARTMAPRAWEPRYERRERREMSRNQRAFERPERMAPMPQRREGWAPQGRPQPVFQPVPMRRGGQGERGQRGHGEGHEGHGAGQGGGHGHGRGH